jgi:DNA-binding CsgD family transcriptional regulator
MTEDTAGRPRNGNHTRPPIAAAQSLARLLSARETAVFELLGLGYDNRSMARLLGVSERTVKRHVTAILAKLGLESRLQAGLVALITTSAAPGPEGDRDRADRPEGRMDPVRWANQTGWHRGRSQEETMAFDALEALRQAGNPVDLISPEQREVLLQLTEAEVLVLNSVKQRLDAAADEVEAHGGGVKIV